MDAIRSATTGDAVMWILLNPRMWVATGIFTALLIGSIGVYRAGARSVQAKWDKAAWQSAMKTAELQAQIRKAEADLQERLTKANQEKRDAINTLNRRHSDIVAGLSNRPERGSSEANADTGNRENASGCTGQQLYRPDAEFLVGEAARADAIRIELQACYSAYDRARESLK